MAWWCMQGWTCQYGNSMLEEHRIPPIKQQEQQPDVRVRNTCEQRRTRIQVAKQLLVEAHSSRPCRPSLLQDDFNALQRTWSWCRVDSMCYLCPFLCSRALLPQSVGWNDDVAPCRHLIAHASQPPSLPHCLRLAPAFHITMMPMVPCLALYVHAIHCCCVHAAVTSSAACSFVSFCPATRPFLRGGYPLFFL